MPLSIFRSLQLYHYHRRPQRVTQRARVMQKSSAPSLRPRLTILGRQGTTYYLDSNSIRRGIQSKPTQNVLRSLEPAENENNHQSHSSSDRLSPLSYSDHCCQLESVQSSASLVAPLTSIVTFQTPNPLSVTSRPANVMGPMSHFGGT